MSRSSPCCTSKLILSSTGHQVLGEETLDNRDESRVHGSTIHTFAVRAQGHAHDLDRHFTLVQVYEMSLPRVQPDGFDMRQ